MEQVDIGTAARCSESIHQSLLVRVELRSTGGDARRSIVVSSGRSIILFPYLIDKGGAGALARRPGHPARAVYRTQHRDPDRPRRIARIRHILALDPPLSHHAAEHCPADARRAAQAGLTHRVIAVRQMIEHTKLRELLLR